MVPIEHIKAVEKASQYSDFYSGFALDSIFLMLFLRRETHMRAREVRWCVAYKIILEIMYDLINMQENPIYWSSCYLFNI